MNNSVSQKKQKLNITKINNNMMKLQNNQKTPKKQLQQGKMTIVKQNKNFDNLKKEEVI